MWGPTCDPTGRHEGSFLLPSSVKEAITRDRQRRRLRRAIAGSFNGYGAYEDVILPTSRCCRCTARMLILPMFPRTAGHRISA
jgi:hypothetical protein